MNSMRQVSSLLPLAAALAWVVELWPAGMIDPFWFVLADLILFLDLADLLVRLYVRRMNTGPGSPGRVAATSIPLHIGDFSPYQARLHLRPWALVASVHNDAALTERFVESHAAWRDRLWIIDDASTDDTWPRLQKLGIHCLRGECNRHKPGAIKTLLALLPAEIETVVVLDPDARIVSADLERPLFEFQRSGMAALCPHLTIREDGFLADLQSFEYALSFAIGRKSLADHCITSGIAVYRRDALAAVLDGHTLSVYAEDLKNAFMLLASGERIYYDGRLVVETEGKREWRAWFSQRVGWYYGLLKVYLEHFNEVRRSAAGRFFLNYHFLVYMGVFALLMHPLKLVSLAILVVSAVNGLDDLSGWNVLPDTAFNQPLYFPLVYLKYALLALAAVPLAVRRGERGRVLAVLPFYPLYVLAHLAPVTIGYLNWFTLRLKGRKLYRDHYESSQRS